MTEENTTTLLLVEDDTVLRDMYSEKFKNASYEVITAGDGAEGELLALEKHPDLLILDLHLPKQGGMELLENIRKNDWGATAPVIILTNMDTDNDRLQKIMDFHPAYYINKSDSTPEEILEKVKEVLSL